MEGIRFSQGEFIGLAVVFILFGILIGYTLQSQATQHNGIRFASCNATEVGFMKGIGICATNMTILDTFDAKYLRPSLTTQPQPNTSMTNNATQQIKDQQTAQYAFKCMDSGGMVAPNGICMSRIYLNQTINISLNNSGVFALSCQELQNYINELWTKPNSFDPTNSTQILLGSSYYQDVEAYLQLYQIKKC